MINAAMRLVAPSFVFGLAAATISPGEGTENSFPGQENRPINFSHQ
jgi:hypothetical protein